MTIEPWLFGLDQSPRDLARCAALLDPQEHARAARFRDPRDRERYIARHGQLRQLLASYLDRPAHAVAFAHNPCGKPLLVDGRGWQFSLSRSGDVALCAVVRGVEVGCDIERLDPALADPAAAERFFAPAEAAGLRALPQALFAERFFDVWTAKEAFVKALGCGLSLPLDSFVVPVPPERRPTSTFLAQGRRWALHASAPVPGYCAAIVAPAEAALAIAPPRWFEPAQAAAGHAA